MAFVLYFFRRHDRYAAAIVVFWVSQSLFNVATYAGDARAQLLPLVGGEDVLHDWAYMLGSLGWLHHDTTIEGGLRAVAFLLWLGALLGALRHARPHPDSARREGTGVDSGAGDQAARPRSMKT